jgi:hypothetical protein
MKASRDAASPFLSGPLWIPWCSSNNFAIGNVDAYDEPFQVAIGMEWLQHRNYTIEQLQVCSCDPIRGS